MLEFPFGQALAAQSRGRGRAFEHRVAGGAEAQGIRVLFPRGPRVCGSARRRANSVRLRAAHRSDRDLGRRGVAAAPRQSDPRGRHRCLCAFSCLGDLARVPLGGGGGGSPFEAHSARRVHVLGGCGPAAAAARSQLHLLLSRARDAGFGLWGGAVSARRGAEHRHLLDSRAHTTARARVRVGSGRPSAQPAAFGR